MRRVELQNRRHGITLTASAHLDMFESSWSPADNAQAIKRISRIGQTRNCRARFHFPFANSIDQRVTQRVSRRRCYRSDRRLLTICYRQA